MIGYRVKFSIDIEANDPEGAVWQALGELTAGRDMVFRVVEDWEGGATQTVTLDPSLTLMERQ